MTTKALRSELLPPAPREPAPAEPAGALRWVQNLFKRPLRLERRGAQIHVTLAPVPTAPPEPPAPAERRRDLVRQVRTELRALLDLHAGTRRVVPHLACIEQTLGGPGLRGIGRLPLPVLHKALTQLDSLVDGTPGPGLAELRRRIAAAISLRLGGTPGAATAHSISDFHTDDRLEVSEASHSQFDELERSWTGTLPEDMAAQMTAERSAG
jgi:hypothetical protein